MNAEPLIFKSSDHDDHTVAVTHTPASYDATTFFGVNSTFLSSSPFPPNLPNSSDFNDTFVDDVFDANASLVPLVLKGIVLISIIVLAVFRDQCHTTFLPISLFLFSFFG